MIAQKFLEEAMNALKLGRPLPASLDDSDIYVAELSDTSIVPLDVIIFERKEYRVGPKRTTKK